MQVMYISGPLWSPWAPVRALNVYRAARAAWRGWRSGYAVICPHTNSGLASVVWPAAERMARWLEGDCAMIERLAPGDLVYMLRGWEQSTGARAERQVALETPGVIVVYEDGSTQEMAPLRVAHAAARLIAEQLTAAGATPPSAAALDDLEQALLGLLRALGDLDVVVASSLRSYLIVVGTVLRAWREQHECGEDGPDVD